VGDDASNLALSQRRADAVNAVIGRISAKSGLSFDVEAKGEADPVAPNDIDGRDNPDGRARNRRVTISYTAG
jgi:OOP family OmpA-OmpF porin